MSLAELDQVKGRAWEDVDVSCLCSHWYCSHTDIPHSTEKLAFGGFGEDLLDCSVTYGMATSS